MADHDKEIDDLIEKIKTEYKVKVDTEITNLRDNLDKSIRRKVIGFAALIVTMAVLTFITVLQYSTRDVNKAVIDLMKDIISAQQVIRDSKKEIDESKRLLTETQADLNAAKTDLMETKKIYDKRIGDFTKPKNKIYELTWSNIRTQNQPPTQDIIIDLRHATSIFIEIEILPTGKHESTNWDLNILVSATETGNYKLYFDQHFSNKDLRSFAVTEGPNFMKLNIDVNDNRRADVKAIVTVGY